MRKSSSQWRTIDANEAVARVAYAASEVIAIYPITPATPMGEWADAWSAEGRPNALGTVPQVIEMQSEGGAAGAVHGALQAGALATTFTASQGLLLMIPNMYKIAGELTPTVFHVAARSIATHALSIFGDHSDVMATRATGWALLASSTVQEAQDLAVIAHAATLRARIPFLHFFDGFRTSHEINKLKLVSEDDLRTMLDSERIHEHRRRSLDPDRPVLRGTAQNPDVFFQAREAINPYYDNLPGIVRDAMQQFAGLTGREYRLFDYVGSPHAQSVVILMGSGCGAAEEAIEALVRAGESVGMVKVRLFQPFSVADLLDILPSTVRRIAVLDRTKEPGAVGEPLYQSVATEILESWHERHSMTSRPEVFGGRYGLSGKEFTPAMVKAVFDELKAEEPRRHFTVGITDDVTHLSLKWDDQFDTEADDVVRMVFHGLGSDGTVGANKNTVKIVGERTELFTQGYFVYDSKKAGAVTVSHLRFSPRPIRSTYKIRRANFVACHQFQFLERIDVLSVADRGAKILLNSPFPASNVWQHLPIEVQQQLIAKGLRLFVIDAVEIAEKTGLGKLINTVMQTSMFLLTDVLPRDVALAAIKDAITESYGKRGETILRRNFAAVDMVAEALEEVEIPGLVSSDHHREPPIRTAGTDFVQRVTSLIIAGQGDLLPVSAMPVDGTFPTGTARYEKRSIAQEIPIWDPTICTECGLCALVCPHAAIRIKAYAPILLSNAPSSFPSRGWKDGQNSDRLLTVQVAPDDCTGCGMCVEVCPARSKSEVRHKAINLERKRDHLDRERARWAFFEQLPEADRTQLNIESVKQSQLLQPLFEFSGACAGCGETPYLSLLTRLFGDRTVVANATGCSSIFGGNLPTTPWTSNAAGRGPAWSNSLFEDNAEFGLGMRLALDQKERHAHELLTQLDGDIDEEFLRALLDAKQHTEQDIADQRKRVERLRNELTKLDQPEARQLVEVLSDLVRKSVWIIGGDGWAYDIGFGGLDHVLASGRNVNVLVLDTEVYSNTGGQASKSTPRAAVAKFAASGKPNPKKDLGLLAMGYGNVYVAQIALGANPLQAIRAFEEAESYPGPSLILAYSHCIAHGIDMSKAMAHQRLAAQCGYWPLYRYDPRLAHDGLHPFQLDSHKPTKPLATFAMEEGRFAALAMAQPERSAELLELAQRDVDERWHYYEQLAGLERTLVHGQSPKHKTEEVR
jgi:pyruvate-ferredoxin/flavodoxin oxidoreductase